MRTFYVYIMASRSRVLYVGVTNDLARRTSEHKRGLNPGFTSRYRVTRLVYFEQFADIRDAIAREKEIKGWVRTKKIGLALSGAKGPAVQKQVLRVARLRRAPALRLEPLERVGLRGEHGENGREPGNVEHLPDRLVQAEEAQRTSPAPAPVPPSRLTVASTTRNPALLM